MRLLVLLAALVAAPSPVEPVEQSVAVESYSGSILLPDVRSTLEKLLRHHRGRKWQMKLSWSSPSVGLEGSASGYVAPVLP